MKTDSNTIHRWESTLADGRAIIYFDEPTANGAAPRRVERDSRDLPVVTPASQMRYDALLGEWVGIAGHRQTRTYHPPADQCPLCPTTAGNLSEIPSPAYDVVVFENRFPSFAGTGDPVGAGPFAVGPGLGRCEVICFSSDHRASFTSLGAARIRTVLQAWTDRTAALMEQPGVEQVFCFENRGVEIGVTLAHPHGQIYGYPFVTPKTAAMIRSVERHRADTGRNLFDDVVANEIAEGSRIVAENEHWVAFVPFASRWPVEVHLYPRTPHARLTDLSSAEQDAFVALHLEVLQRMEGLFDDTLPAITAWHQAPRGHEDDVRLHLELFSIRRDIGKIKFLAGSESAMGAFVSDVQPEQTAQRLRAVKP